MELDNPVAERIRQEISDDAVVLYMKGSPIFPQCGFSAAVVQILTELEVPFKGVDVLTDPSLRDDPPALRQGRVRRRLRHHPRDALDRRAAQAHQGQGRRAGELSRRGAPRRAGGHVAYL